MIDFSTSDEFFTVQVSSNREFKEIELLLLSRAIPFSSKNGYWQKIFYIPLHQEDYTKQEISIYLEENEDWPPMISKQKIQVFGFSWINVWLSIALGGFHWFTTRIDLRSIWLAQGRFTADKILNGDWWRLATSLTLHVDDAHLLSNMVGLIVFAGGVNTFVGMGVSWLLILIAAALGNLLNAVFYQVGHDAIGASTAVFAAVGIISIFGIRNYYHKRQFKGRYLVPFMAGFGLFAMLGTNPQTDVTAHLFGFLSGATVGILFLPFSNHRYLRSHTIQLVSLIIFCLGIYTCWNLALK